MQLVPRPENNYQPPQPFKPERWQNPSEREKSKLSRSDNSDSEASKDRFALKYLEQDLAEDRDQRVVIFIDGSNLFYAASYLSLEIDYVKLLHWLTGNRRLVRAYFYTGVDQTNEKQQGFLHWMRRHGYRVISKDLLQFTDGSKKANVAVEVAVDMMTLADYCDTIVLLSGDGNLAYAVNAIAYRGVQVEIVSLRSMTSDSLINLADRYTDLGSIKHNIQRT